MNALLKKETFVSFKLLLVKETYVSILFVETPLYLRKKRRSHMDLFTLGLWIVTLLVLVFSFIKSFDKTLESLKMAFSLGRSMILSILNIILAIGLILAFLPPENIAAFVENQNPIVATLFAAIFGTITLIPAFIAFPLVGSLVNASVGLVPAVAFLTTLTMVGIVTFPLEQKEFGLKFALTRNLLSFGFALVIAFAMGVIL